MLKPKRTFQSVVEELTEGLEHGTIVLESAAEECREPRPASVSEVPSESDQKLSASEGEARERGRESA